MKMILDIRNEVDATPGISPWNFGVRRYAVDLLEEYLSNNKLTVYSEASKLKDITRDDLLCGYEDCEKYSRNSNSFIFTDDICMRLFHRKPYPGETKDWLGLQGTAIEQACELLFQAIKKYQ